MTIENPEGTVGPGRDRWRSPRNERGRDGKKRGGRGGHRNGGPGFAAPVVVICAVVAVLVALDAWANAGQIYWDVQVGTVELGGMTPEEARQALEERAVGPLKEIELNGPEDVAFTAEELGVDVNVDATVEGAYSVGREGNILGRLADRGRAAYGAVRIPPDVDYRSEVAEAKIGDLAGRTNAKPRDASVVVEGSEVRVVPAQVGYELDVQATAREVGRALEHLSGEAALVGETFKPGVPTEAAERAAEKARKAMAGPVVLTADGRRWTLSPADVGQTMDFTRCGGEIRVGLNEERLRASLAGMYAALTVEPVEAGFVVNGVEVSVTESQMGKSILEGKLFGAIRSGLFNGQRNYEVPVTSIAPELTTTEAEKLKPTTLLGEYRTDYTWDTDPGRRENMRRASDAISGTLVPPGEVFSYNAVTEPLDYEDAKVIENGAVAYEEGGGLSQVSSTLYMAANLAGLEIVEANPHYAELSYIRPGFDTTVWFGALDLRFENNTGGYVLIQEWLDPDGFNYARIYGRPTGREVKMWSEKVFDGTDAEGKPTTRWVTYKKVTQNGEVIFDGIFRRDTYKELDPYEPQKEGKPSG